MSNKWILSATELETFTTCKRKWAYVYLAGIKPPPSKAAALGSAVHKELQQYITDNLINYETHEGQIASSGLRYLPQKLPTEQVEKSFFFTHEGHIFHGYIDFYEDLGSQTWLIADHKTCSSFKTALTPAQLKTNTQAVVYAQWAFQELKAQTVKLKWIYYRTKGTPLAQCVEAEIKSEEQPPLFETQLRIASDIKEIVEKKTDVLVLPKNLSACFKYGPCPFLTACKNNQRLHHEEQSVAKVSLKKDDQESFHLFLDCAPIKNKSPYQNTIELSEFLQPVLKKIQQEKNLAHYRLAGYGQHVGIMAFYLEEYLKEKKLDRRTAILSSSKTPEGIDTLQTLSAAASKVIRGF